MNHLIFNTQKRRLYMAGYAQRQTSQTLSPFAADSGGRMILSPQLDIDITAGNFPVRPLNDATDSVTMTGSAIDIRNLRADRDGMGVSSQSYAYDSDTTSISILSTVYMLPKDTSMFRENSYTVLSTSGISVIVTVALQIAPIDDDAYYIDDGSSSQLIGGSELVLTPTKPMRWMRVRITSALSLANIVAYYFGRT